MFVYLNKSFATKISERVEHRVQSEFKRKQTQKKYNRKLDERKLEKKGKKNQ